MTKELSNISAASILRQSQSLISSVSPCTFFWWAWQNTGVPPCYIRFLQNVCTLITPVFDYDKNTFLWGDASSGLILHLHESKELLECILVPPPPPPPILAGQLSTGIFDEGWKWVVLVLHCAHSLCAVSSALPWAPPTWQKRLMDLKGGGDLMRSQLYFS